MRHVVLIVLAELCALLAPLPVQADDEHILEWAQVDKPGISGNIVVTPSEVNELAFGSGSVIYALDTSANATKSSKVYKSVNGGSSWTDITSSLISAGAVLPATKIAAAPDTTGLVAVVTDDGTGVYLSANGGGTWTNLGVPGLAGKIQAITISKKYKYIETNTLVNEIAIGTAEWGDTTTTGQVWVYQYGITLTTWQNQNLTIDPAHIGGEVSAIAYSPSYSRDKTIIVVASTSDSDVDAGPPVDYRSQTWLCLGYRDTDVGTTQWNNAVFTGYPVAIGTLPSGGDGTGVSSISSSIALPSNYSTSSTALMKLFVGYNRDPDTAFANDVYLINDTTVRRLDASNSGTTPPSAINISSIAYYGTTTSGKLLAGDENPFTSFNVQVRRTANPFDVFPTWVLASLPPSGPGNSKVSWSSDGNSAYCGTGQLPGVGLDESAFSISTDGGDNWQQISLIDTILKLADIAVTPDSKTLFLTSYSAFGPEGVWRSTLIEEGIGVYWSRQLNMNTNSQRIILRLSPNYTSDYTIYAFEPGGELLYISHDRGNSWKRRLTLGATIDGVAADADTFYVALPGGYVRRATNDGLIWGKLVFTGVDDINMLTITSNGTILVGGRKGDVAYSNDGGASFTLINETIGTGDVQVVGDVNYQDNGIIYASTNASDSGIWRWRMGISTYWEQIDKSITDLGTGQRIGGLTTGPEGTLYALRAEPAGGISRSLNPAALDNIEFDITNKELPADVAFDSSAIFPHTLPYLKVSTNATENEIWSIDTAHDTVYRFEDTLATNFPTLVSPVNMYEDMVNSVTGRAADIAFSWNAPSLKVTNYEIGIYTDAACTIPAQLCFVASLYPNIPNISVVIGPYQSATSNQCLEYVPGATYYWRVRTIGPLRSPWSEVHGFAIAPLHELVINLLSPLNGAADVSQTPAFSWDPAIGVTDYQLALADDASFTSPIVSASINNTGFALTQKLAGGKTYFWKVRAISPVGSDWSTIANFTIKDTSTESSLPPVAIQTTTSVTTVTLTAPAPTQVIVAPSLPPSSTPVTIWVIIGIGSILAMGIIILILRTAR
ncbi:MAG: hypothetical protein ABR954_06670 [Dehalococcoidales bacterium]